MLHYQQELSERLSHFHLPNNGSCDLFICTQRVSFDCDPWRSLVVLEDIGAMEWRLRQALVGSRMDRSRDPNCDRANWLCNNVTVLI